MIVDNVIHVDPPTWYVMRQCRESVNYLKHVKHEGYEIEVHGEEALFKHYMNEVLGRAA